MKKRTRESVMAEVNRITGEVEHEMKAAESCLRDAQKNDRVLHWMEWNALSYANARILSLEWSGIAAGVARMFDAGASVDEVLVRLKEVRDEFVRQVMRADQTNKSTSLMANALEDERIQVLRQVAGDTLRHNSLSFVLYSFGVDVG